MHCVRYPHEPICKTAAITFIAKTSLFYLAIMKERTTFALAKEEISPLFRQNKGLRL